MIEKLDITSREKWLKDRESDVTASAAAALLGVHPFISAAELYYLKAGILPEDPEQTPPMRRGHLLEPVAAQLLGEVRPGWKLQYPVGIYYRDPEVRIGATPDCRATDENGKRGAVQFKSVQASTFWRTWRDADGAITPPLYAVVQAMIEAHLTGAEWAAVAALVVNFGIELHVIPVPIHAGVIDRIKTEVAAFWNRVARKDPPPADYARDGRLIAKLFPESDGSIIDLSSDNALPALAAEDQQLAGEIKGRKERRDAIKAEVLAKIGAASGATFQGGFVSAKTVQRKAYRVEATSYRDCRIKLMETTA